MKKLVAMFKALPKEVRMMLALAGLASPIGAIYFLQRFFKLSVFQLILIVAGIVVVICILAFLISLVFGRGKKKRSKKMESELTSGEGQGPLGVDVRAQIKANNDKFFTAVREMKRNFQTSVYDLPWYVVIGDSGCGKTRLINNGGLTFAAGRPEGYQLGTLNYNWWFTEDAVFVDMAGRLCNPQEDADHREWQGFLDTIGRGRKGFPINGVVLCISADHLLQDSPEKHEADANTALERLRDLQSKLGVTFATYLVITKCDKILGFMQLFDTAERDITIKHQIFGWSKPGAFNELYDPEQFDEQFGELYARLNELRTRRLHDDEQEVDLGLAYSFPEEFRTLRDPIQTYLRILFPPIKNPRGIKNLIFRGVYFTSSTQEGEIILKHLRERLGPEAADQFPTLDTLYPEKKPLFVKQLFFRKMFPEHGLVFRNEKDVVKNRKLGRLLKVGSTVLAIILVTFVVWGSIRLNKLTVTPRTNAAEAAGKAAEPKAALSWGTKLASDVRSFNENRFILTLLSTGIGASGPIDHLTTIRMRLFEESVMRQTFADVDNALRLGLDSLVRARLPVDEAAERYLSALLQYVTWFGCRESETLPDQLDYAGFKTLSRVVVDPESVVVSRGDDFLTEANDYFTAAHARKDWRNPARLLGAGREPLDTIYAALGHVHKYMSERYATLQGDSPDGTIAAWMHIQEQCVLIDDAYARMLGTDARSLATTEDVRDYAARFTADFDRLDTAMAGIKWKEGTSELFEKIDPIRDAILAQRQRWIDYDRELISALVSCGSRTQDEAAELLPSLQTGSELHRMVGLDEVLWDSLVSTGLASVRYDPRYYEEENFRQIVREVHEAFAHIVRLEKGADVQSADRVSLTLDATHVLGVLADVKKSLPVDLEPPEDVMGEKADEWIAEFDTLLELSDEELEGPDVRADLDAEKWRRTALRDLGGDVASVANRARLRQLLDRIALRLDRERFGDWGFAELYEGWSDPEDSAYSMRMPRELEDAERDTARDDRRRKKEEEEPKKRSRRRPRRSSRSGRSARDSEEEAPRSRSASPARRLESEIPACATSEFLGSVAGDCVDLLSLLNDFDTDFYLASEAGATPPHERCYDELLGRWREYASRYAASWKEAYEHRELNKLAALEERLSDGWDSFSSQCKRRGGGRSRLDIRGVTDEFSPSLEEILRATRWATYIAEDQLSWSQSWDDAYYRDHAEAVEDAVLAALGKHWGEGSFVLNAAEESGRSARSDPPWITLTKKYVSLWDDLIERIGQNTELGRQAKKLANQDYQPDRFEKIPFGEIEKLRRAGRLDDERLTARLVEFERKAQGLLSAALTSVFCRIQDDYLGRRDPPDGWPYLGAARANQQVSAIDFKSFKRFLYDVDRAKTLFAELEIGLPDDAVKRARTQFHNQCLEWYNFLRLEGEGEQLSAGALGMEIKGGDPLSDPEFRREVVDTAQFDYHYWELSLGFKKITNEDGTKADSTPGVLRTATHVNKGKFHNRAAVWDWPQSAGTVAATLVSPLSGTSGTSPSQDLGQASPLALCGYLHGYGYGEGKIWKTLNVWDIADRADPGADVRKVGEMLVFMLERPMPAAIKKLTEVQGDYDEP